MPCARTSTSASPPLLCNTTLIYKTHLDETLASLLFCFSDKLSSPARPAASVSPLFGPELFLSKDFVFAERALESCEEHDIELCAGAAYVTMSDGDKAAAEPTKAVDEIS